MSIKMNLRQGIAAYQALNELPKLPNGKISYTFGYIADKLEDHCRRFERERIKLVRQLAEPDKDGKRTLSALKTEELNDRLEEMLEVEIEINRNPVTLTEVLGADEANQPKLEPSVLRRLQLIILE